MEKPVVRIRHQSELRSRNFGIYINGKLHEGGFFTREAAVEAWQNQVSLYGDSAREQAEGVRNIVSHAGA